MTVLMWGVIFAASLALLVKSADWLLDSAEKIGRAVGLSSFVIGVVIVGIGTSFPEVVSSLFAVWAGATEIVAANAVGSNIANILLVVGLAAVVAKRLEVDKDLIDLELPLLAAATVLFMAFALDGAVSVVESVLLLVLFGVYVWYTLAHQDEAQALLPPQDAPSVLGDAESSEGAGTSGEGDDSRNTHARATVRDIAFLFVGVAGLALGAKYLIDSVIALSSLLGIGVGVISLAAVALGTSLPELLVSVKAAMRDKCEVALGNVFGSNAFNLLLVVGFPGVFGGLVVDDPTLKIGIPVMAAATFLFIISGISRRVHVYEGVMYLVLYVFFVGRLFGVL